MDLTLDVEGSIVNIRAAVLVRTSRGFLFERHKDGYLFAVGGRIKLHEASAEAAKREVEEELGTSVADPVLSALVENFYTDREGKRVHEVMFVYQTTTEIDGELPEGFIEVKKEDIRQFDVRPKVLVELIASGNSEFQHLVNDETR